jgi:acyl-coenzyme A thioesterase PaaI-like protein
VIVKLILPSYDGCFACGKKNPIGLKLSLYLENDQVKAEFTPWEELCGFSGILHGGILSCLIDETLWWSSAVASGRLVVTRDLNLRFIKSVTVRKTYILEGDPARPEGRTYACRGRIMDQNGTVYVEGEGNYFPLRWGKNRNPQEMLSYIDDDGNPLPEDQVYRFPLPEEAMGPDRKPGE